MKRVLVTGAAGFIGAACAREFLRRHWHVTGLVHRRPVSDLQGVTTVSGSLSDRSALASVMNQCGPFDAIVNCAGIASDVARVRLLLEVNHQGARNLAECVAAQSSGRLVHISTTDVYGIRDFVDAGEDTPLEDNLHQGYPRSKILAEQAIAAVLPANRYVLLRPGAVCGQGDKTILPRVIAFLRSSPVVVHFGHWKGANRWPLTNVANVARAAYLAATCDEALGQAYNVVDPTPMTLEEYYRWVLRTYLPHKARIRSITIPVRAAWIYGQVSSLLSRWLGMQHPLFDPSLYALYSVASNLDFNSRKLQNLFSRHGETFVRLMGLGVTIR